MKKYFEVKDGDEILRGFMNVPDIPNKKFPCIIMCHGFTGQMAETHFQFVKIADILMKQGIVAVRFDFAGSGESDGIFKEMTLSKEVHNCESIIDNVRNMDFIDSNNINLLGFSMGGAVSTVVSEKKENNIKNTILLSPAFNIANIFVGGVKGHNIKNYIEKGIVDFDGHVIGKNAIEDALNYNLFECVKKISGKVLLIHGTEDDCVPPYVSIRIHELLQNNSELHMVEGANHCYTSIEYESQVLDLVESFCRDEINAFIK